MLACIKYSLYIKYCMRRVYACLRRAEDPIHPRKFPPRAPFLAQTHFYSTNSLHISLAFRSKVFFGNFHRKALLGIPPMFGLLQPMGVWVFGTQLENFGSFGLNFDLLWCFSMKIAF